jgi:hypothetical protein
VMFEFFTYKWILKKKIIAFVVMFRSQPDPLPI